MGADLTIVKRDEEKKEQAAIWWHLKCAIDRMVANRPSYLSDSEFQELKKAYKFAKDKWLKAFDEDREGYYFRDSYNDSNIARLFGLSYLQVSNTTSYFDEDGNFNVAGSKAWLQIIQECSLDDFEIKVRASYNEESWDGSEDEVVAFFMEKRERFIAFLQKAIDLDSPIEWSV